jgi:hypothetical protein
VSEKPLEYETPVHRPRGWQFLTIVAMVALGVVVLGFAKHIVQSQSPIPKPTTAPAYGTRW